MSLIIAILLGALVGYVASHIMGRNEGFIGSAIIGIIGAFIGNLVSYAIGGGKQAYLAFDLSGLIWSFGGALLLVVILNAIQNRRA